MIQKLKGLGFNSSLLELDDTDKDGADKTELDRFLSGFVDSALLRIQKITDSSEINPQAILLFSICEILPVVWMRASVGENSIKIEGMSINMANPSEEEKKNILNYLLTSAERLLEIKSTPGRDIVSI